MRVILASPEAKVWSARKHIPLGLGYLAAVLREGGHEVMIFDAAIEDVGVEYYLDRAESEGRPYGLIGVTATTPLIPEAWEMAQLCKKRGMYTVLGGPHLTIMPLESMQAPHSDYVDYVFKGESEYSFLELIDTLEAGKKPDMLPGIHFRHSSSHGKEEIVVSPESPMIPDLDALPFPAHDLFKIERYTNLQPLTDGWDPQARSFTILTSRGCPYKCTFCSKPVTGDTWRARSVESVVQEWKWLVNGLGATEIGMTDDIWNLKLPRAKELCRRLVEEGLNTVPWVTVHGMKVNHGDLELYQLMKASGCKRVGFGVENGDEGMLRNVIKKGQTVDMVREAFANAKAAKLQTMGFFIYGMPGDNEETMEKTTELALELDPKLANFLLAAPFPGTAMYDMIQEGGEVFAENWTDYAIHEDKARFVMHDGKYDAELVIKKWRDAYKRFYLYRPHRVAEKLMLNETWRRMPSLVRRFVIGEKSQTADAVAHAQKKSAPADTTASVAA